jgi:hypothetical protein
MQGCSFVFVFVFLLQSWFSDSRSICLMTRWNKLKPTDKIIWSISDSKPYNHLYLSHFFIFKSNSFHREDGEHTKGSSFLIAYSLNRGNFHTWVYFCAVTSSMVACPFLAVD